MQDLSLHHNQLQTIPRELGQLTNLQELSLANNQLTEIPDEQGHLESLQELFVTNNRLSRVPGGLCQLAGLQRLYLGNNRLTRLPAERGQLASLTNLELIGNQLASLPVEIGQLPHLLHVQVEQNPRLLTPPPEIVARGTRAIKEFLHALASDRITRYESKLLLVGEGGTGKSSLLRALRHESFDPHLPTSHGIEVSEVRLPYPDDPSHTMILHAWDFGGQQIYHATHQFFLTRRSLYLVTWNARLGADQGRLSFWLDTIQAFAPDSPVLLVATHTDERAPDLHYALYQNTYPQVVGSFSVSNKDLSGFEELRAMLTARAAKLPPDGPAMAAAMAGG